MEAHDIDKHYIALPANSVLLSIIENYISEYNELSKHKI